MSIIGLEYRHGDSVSRNPSAGLDRLVKVMQRLRDQEHGCAWDIAQTFETIAPYTIEEAYEVDDAIRRGDMEALVDELGDLQLQVVFHAAIAEQSGLFTLRDVMDAIVDKLERRHPHIFGSAADETPGWETLKAAERAKLGDGSALAGIPLSVPALSRAQKLTARAAHVGFHWADAAGARAKVAEELAELDAAGSHAERVEECGDLLLSVVNLARKLGIDSEAALREAASKFEARFRHMEAAEPALASRSLDEQERLWQHAKCALAQPARD